MKTPEEVAREFYFARNLNTPEQIAAEGGPIAELFAEGERELADLLRQRDAEWQDRLKEERGRAFDAGAEAQNAFEYASTIDRLDADETFAAARRAAQVAAREMV